VLICGPVCDEPWTAWASAACLWPSDASDGQPCSWPEQKGQTAPVSPNPSSISSSRLCLYLAHALAVVHTTATSLPLFSVSPMSRMQHRRAEKGRITRGRRPALDGNAHHRAPLAPLQLFSSSQHLRAMRRSDRRPSGPLVSECIHP
jgi:hypothetical protein